MKSVKSVRVAGSQLLESRVVLISPHCGSLPEDADSHRESYNQKLSGHRAVGCTREHHFTPGNGHVIGNPFIDHLVADADRRDTDLAA